MRISLGFIPSMGFSRQGYWSGLPFPSPLDHVFSELFIITHLSWVALHGMAHSLIDLCKPICHNKAVIQEGIWNTKGFDCVDHCGKFLKREYKTTLPVSWETCMWVKKKQLGPDMKKWTGSKLEKEYVKAVYCHPVYLTSVQSTSCEILGWRITNWNQDCQKKYQQP